MQKTLPFLKVLGNDNCRNQALSLRTRSLSEMGILRKLIRPPAETVLGLVGDVRERMSSCWSKALHGKN
jgi:hypothetical protein